MLPDDAPTPGRPTPPRADDTDQAEHLLVPGHFWKLRDGRIAHVLGIRLEGLLDRDTREYVPWDAAPRTYKRWRKAARDAKNGNRQPFMPTGVAHARVWRNQDVWQTQPAAYSEERELPLAALDGSRPGRILVHRDGRADVLNQPSYVRDFIER